MRDDRVLVVAPTGRDSVMVTNVLVQSDIKAEACDGIEDICRRWTDGAGAVFIAEEALTASSLSLLIDVISRQPPWSDLPVIVMTGGGKATRFTTRIAEALQEKTHVTLLERPLRKLTLVSSVRAAIAARRRQYEVRDLLQASRDGVLHRDQFLAMLAHELRNPLAPVRNAVELLRLGSTTKEIQRRALAMMERQVQQMGRLLDDLLDVSRVTHNKITLRKEHLELSDVIARSVESARPLIDARAHQFLAHIDPGAHVVYGDLTRLVQVVSNLLNNAAKYTPEGGQISLLVRREGNDAVVQVRDNGVGLSAELLPNVFNLFSQGRRSLARSEGGLGIGLALVRTLVEMHGGTVAASSEGPDRGSMFEIRIPIVSRPDTLAVGPKGMPEVSVAAPKIILVVDDNQDAADSLALMLEMGGHAVEVAYDGMSGLEAAKRVHPQAAILDIGLPDMSGFEVAEQLRSFSKSTEMMIIALSGYGQPEDKERSLRAGFDVHLVKPVDVAELTQALGRKITRAKKEP